jgi:hypothetical protein
VPLPVVWLAVVSVYSLVRVLEPSDLDLLLTLSGGPRNAIPGAIMFSLFGFVGQTVSNYYDKTDMPVSDEPQLNFWQKFAGLKWMPVTVLKDNEYEDMLRERQLKLEAEIALVDERIEALRTQYVKALVPDNTTS